MSYAPVPGFRFFPTHHCVSGSLHHIYAFHGYPISEEMLLGLGEGVGFIYWHTQGSLPFLGGRANIERPGSEGLEKTIGRRTGVEVATYRTSSTAKAERTLLAMLAAGQPVMLVLDMGFLPYFDFGGQEYHFGYHVVVACGYDPLARQVLLADRDGVPHLVSLEDLARARGSQYKPFPPRHTWYTFDFRHQHLPETVEILRAMHQSCQAMLQPPIANLGVKGIAKAAERLRHWPEALNERDLRDACLNTAIMIQARGGTGGGLFRYMYARFLQEAAALVDLPELEQIGEVLHACGDQWERAAGIFEQAYSAEDPVAYLAEASTLLRHIAWQEERAWQALRSTIRSGASI